MIDQHIQSEVVASVTKLWALKRSEPAFLAAFSGKERGHRIADLVEEWTVNHLESEFVVKYETSAGRRRARSMGDLWLESEGMYNPVNVKAGVRGVGGQPNLVSLAKLTEGLLRHFIDSYYLLFVKFTDVEEPEPDVELIDLLDHLDFVHFDSGTGQMMLRADRFMKRMDEGAIGKSVVLSIEEAVSQLLQMRRDGDEKLVKNRAEKLAKLEILAAVFDPEAGIDQTELELR